MAMALGVTASAYAANPFSDVPTGHWAYDAVNRLAAAGIVDGYGDGNFGGERLMTRYEMAQIVAKAMAKGANVDRLAAEFADELDSLGVRVAALEKKADNVKITGQIRYEYAGRDGDFKKDKGSVAKNRLRTRLFVNGSVNEDWTYTARIQNDQNLANDSGDEDTKLNQAYVTGKLGGFNVMAGKAPVFLANGNLYDDTAEVIQLTYGKNVKISGYWGQITEKDSGYMADKAYGASLSGKIGRLDLAAGYDRFEDLDAGFTKISNNAVWNAGANYNFGDFILGAMYLNSDISDKAVEKGADTDGFVISAAYKGAKAAKQGTWGLWGNYYDQGAVAAGSTEITTETTAEELSEEESFRDFITQTHAEDYEAQEGWYRWTYTVKEIDVDRILETLKNRYEANGKLILTLKDGDYSSQNIKNFSKVTDITIVKRGPGGVADELVIATDKGTYKIISEYNIRAVLCDGVTRVVRQDGSEVSMPSLLPSAFFVIEPSHDKKNMIGYNIIGGGFGHGVGMSQNGAKNMALQGLGAEQILNFFYEGCEICSGQ